MYEETCSKVSVWIQQEGEQAEETRHVGLCGSNSKLWKQRGPLESKLG